ncbi:hypothetical protein FQN52_003180 [Onygenales sp. PD_12]|nr:hypothetical protein FQN52_003180 [Onygenales sp. PD_12]
MGTTRPDRDPWQWSDNRETAQRNSHAEVPIATTATKPAIEQTPAHADMSGINLNKLLIDAFDKVGKESGAGGLDDSKWAVKQNKAHRNYPNGGQTMRRKMPVNHSNQHGLSRPTGPLGIVPGLTNSPCHNRKLVLRNIPPCLSTPSKIQSLIFGGAIDKFRLLEPDTRTGTTTAEVVFCDARDCNAYFEDHRHGIKVTVDMRLHTIPIEVTSYIPPTDIANWVPGEKATRVVRIASVDRRDDEDIASICALVRERAASSSLERMTDVYNAGENRRTITIRFCSVNQSKRFCNFIRGKYSLATFAPEYAPDPCQIAAGFHWD